MSVEAMRQALEALELALSNHGVMLLSDPPQDAWKTRQVESKGREAVTALRAALDTPYTDYERGFIDGMQEQMKTSVDRAVNATCKREWVGLTDEERRNIREWQEIQGELGPVWAPMMLYLYLAIEAKLKEKNGV